MAVYAYRKMKAALEGLATTADIKAEINTQLGTPTHLVILSENGVELARETTATPIAVDGNDEIVIPATTMALPDGIVKPPPAMTARILNDAEDSGLQFLIDGQVSTVANSVNAGGTLVVDIAGIKLSPPIATEVTNVPATEVGLGDRPTLAAFSTVYVAENASTNSFDFVISGTERAAGGFQSWTSESWAVVGYLGTTGNYDCTIDTSGWADGEITRSFTLVASNDSGQTTMLVTATVSANVTAPPPPVNTGGSTQNTVDNVIDAMFGDNDGTLDGVTNPDFRWRFNPDPAQLAMGAVPRGDLGPTWFTGSGSVEAQFKTSTWWKAFTQWLIAFEEPENTANNVRIQVKNTACYYLSKSTGLWNLIAFSHGTTWYKADKAALQYVGPVTTSNDNPTPANPELLYNADGSSALAVNPSQSYIYHGEWLVNRVDISGYAWDIDAIYTTCEARLVLEDPNGTNDLGAARWMLQSGADYWPEINTQVGGAPGALGLNPGVGLSRCKRLSGDWQHFNFCTLDIPRAEGQSGADQYITRDELRANPPPGLATLGGGGDGILPVVTPGGYIQAPLPGTPNYNLWASEYQGAMASLNDAWNLNRWAGAAIVNQGVAVGASTSDKKNSYIIDVSCTVTGPQPAAAGTEVKSYPQVFWGQPPGFQKTTTDNVPILISEIQSMWTGFKTLSTTLSGDAFGHLSLDMRTMSSGQAFPDYNAAESSIRSELFVVIENFGNYGEHGVVPAQRTPEWYRGTYTIGGSQWHFYIQAGATNTPQLIWIPAGELPNPINLAALIKWGLVTRFSDLAVNPLFTGNPFLYGRAGSSVMINANEYFTSNGAGIEVVDGDMQVFVDGAYFCVNIPIPAGTV